MWLPPTSSLWSWGMQFIHWNVTAASGNPHYSESETREKTVYSQDAVFGTCHSSFFWCGWSGCQTSLMAYYHTEKWWQSCACRHLKKKGNSSWFLLLLFAFSVGFAIFLLFPVLTLYPFILCPGFIRLIFKKKIIAVLFLTVSLTQKYLIKTKIHCILFGS